MASAASIPPQQAPTKLRRGRRGVVVQVLFAVRRSRCSLAYALGLIVLIVLRALVDHLGFISMGWLLVLALVPILPWLIPALHASRCPRGAVRTEREASRRVRDRTRECGPTGGRTWTGRRRPYRRSSCPGSRCVADAVHDDRRNDGHFWCAGRAEHGGRHRCRRPWHGHEVAFAQPLFPRMAHRERARPALGRVHRKQIEHGGLFVGLCGAADVCTRIEATYPQCARVATQLEYLDVRRPAAGPMQPGPGPSALDPCASSI